MRAHFLFSRAALALACSMAAGLGLPVSAATPPSPAEPAASAVNNSPLNGPLFYQLFMAELEARGGQKGMGYQLMLDAARRTSDETLFRRAVGLASEMGDGPGALAAVQAWRTALPNSVQATRFEVQLLLALDRHADAAAATRVMLDLTPEAEQAGTFASLPRLFARNRDRKQTLQLLEPVLQPWVNKPATRVAASVTLGRIASAAGDNDRAIALAREAHAHEPTADGPALLALELLAAGPEADAIVLDHLKHKPGASAIRILYARVLSSMQRYGEAATQLEAVTQADPRIAAPWLTLAALQLELKRPAEATATVNRYLAGLKDGSIVPTTPTAVAGQQIVISADADGDGESDEPVEDQGVAQAYFLLARAAEQQRDFAGAEAWLAKVTDPERALDVAARRAELLARQGKLRQAIDVLRKAPETRPESARTKLVLEAQLHSDAKQWAAAESVLAQASKRFPNDAELLYQQAMMAEKLDRVEDMERLLRRVIEIRPDHHHAYNALGYSLAERNLRLTEARELIVKALELAPGEPFITDSLGWVEYRLGNRTEALRLLKQAYRLRPDVEIGAHLGELLWVTGQQEEARRVLREVRQRDANNQVLRDTLARLKVDL